MEKEFKDDSSGSFEKVVANSPLGIGFFNENGQWLHVNPSLINLLGYSEEELEHLDFFELLENEESLHQCQIYLKELLQEEKGLKSHEAILIKQDHSKIWASITYTLLNHSSQSNVVYSVQIHDLTHQKRASYLTNNEEMSSASQLAAGIAHEVKNPLTAIKGFIQLMLQHGNTEEYLKIIESEVNRMESMLNEFLLLGKPYELKLSSTDLLHLVNQVITLLQTQAIMKEIEFELHSDDHLPEIECDESRLKQVFINLIKNAIEATSNGRMISIEIRNGKEQGTIETSIIDQGPGIPKDQLALLGRPFFSTKRNGTGLGLMMSISITKEHNGDIHFTSDQSGTIAKVTLPITQPKANQH